MHRGHNIKS
jgi:hypothetical protein